MNFSAGVLRTIESTKGSFFGFTEDTKSYQVQLFYTHLPFKMELILQKTFPRSPIRGQNLCIQYVRTVLSCTVPYTFSIIYNIITQAHGTIINTEDRTFAVVVIGHAPTLANLGKPLTSTHRKKKY